MKKKIFIIIFLFFALIENGFAYSSDPKEFITEVVNEAKKVLIDSNSKEFKPKKLSEMALKTVDIKGVAYYTLGSYRKKLRSGEINDKEVEIPVSSNTNINLPTMDIPGMPGSQMGMINLGDVFGKGFGKQKKIKKMTVQESHAHLLTDETEKLLDNEKMGFLIS